MAKKRSRAPVIKDVAAFLGVTAKVLEKAQGLASEPRLVVDGIDVTLPRQLDRRGKRLSDTQLKQLLAGPGWKPFRVPEKGEDMAKLNALIENRDAPVTVHLRDSADKMKDISFADMNAFEEWYRPTVHRYLGTSNNAKLTEISIDLRGKLEEMETPKGKKTIAPPKKTTPVAKPAGGSSAVWVNGKEYSSLLIAFQQLKLPVNKHKKFRADLKKARKLDFEHDKKTFAFEYR